MSSRKPYTLNDFDLSSALDETEQETLITSLSTANRKSNNTYTLLFLLLPITAIIPYLPTLFAGSSTALLSLLSISSLLITAYVLYVLPHGTTGVYYLDKYASPKGDTAPLPRLGQRIDKGPIELYLPTMNAILATLLMLSKFFAKNGPVERWVGFELLPAFIYGIVLAVKIEMGSVQPERDLTPLKYGLKGA